MKNHPADFLKRVSAQIWIIIILSTVCYALMLPADFKTMDDQATIIDNPAIRSFHRIPELFTTSFFGGNSYYRPLVSLSNLVNYKMAGPNPFVFNLTNLFLHIFVALSVFGLMRVLLKERQAAFYTGLLFAVHPIHWSAVSNVAGRAVILCGLFFVLSVLCFCLSWEKRNWKWYVSSLAAFVLSLLSKEAGAVLPAILISYLLFLPKPRAAFFSICLWILPFAILDGTYILVRKLLGITNVGMWLSWKAMLLGVATFLCSVVTYLRLSIFPTELYFDRARKFITSFHDPVFLAAVILFVLLAVILWKKRKEVRPEIWFFISWFWITLLPVAQLVPIVASAGYITAAEHLLYIPAVGFFPLLVLAVQAAGRYLLRGEFVSRRVLVVIAAGIYLFMILTTIRQSIYAANDIAMLEQSLKCNPNNSRVQSALALALAKKKLYKEAEARFRKALNVDPTDARARIGLGKVLFDEGKFMEGLNEYEQVRDAGGMQDLLKNNLRLSYDFLIARYKANIQSHPEDPAAHYSLGVVYSRSGRTGEAVAKYKKALECDPHNRHALFNLASSYAALQEVDLAITAFHQVLDSHPEAGRVDELDYQSAMSLSALYQEIDDNIQSAKYKELAKRMPQNVKEFKETRVVKFDQ